MRLLLCIFIAVLVSFLYSFMIHVSIIDGDIYTLEVIYIRTFASGALLATVLRHTPHKRLLTAGCILIATWPAFSQTARHTYLSLHQDYFSQYKLIELKQTSPNLPDTWLLNGNEHSTTTPSYTLPLNLATRNPTTSLKIQLPPPTPETLATLLLKPLSASLKRSFTMTLYEDHVRMQPYLTLFTYGRLTIQIVNNGYLITIPNQTGTDVEAAFTNDISSPLSINTWIVRMSPQRFTISLNNISIYSSNLVYMNDYIIIGDDKSDTDHGGIINVHNIRLECSRQFYPTI